ncbi:MAG: saccharopine dehydrogenase family protein [Candidatus Bathyarchaeia archaeon]
MDIRDQQSFVNTLKGWDVVVNATASKLSMDVLKTAMRADIDVTDLAGGSYPLEGEIYDEVRESDITAIPGCGVDPGLIDILSGQGMYLIDEVKEVEFACGGLPKDTEPPLYYKIVFGGKRMPIRLGKVPMIKNRSVVQVDRYTDLEPIFAEGLPTMEAFYDGYPSSLLKLCEQKGVETFKVKTIRYKGFVDRLSFLMDLGLISSEPVNYKGIDIIPVDFFQDLVYPLVKFDPGKAIGI